MAQKKSAANKSASKLSSKKSSSQKSGDRSSQQRLRFTSQQKLRFTKMHGLGNDFVIVGPDVLVTPALAKAIGDRHFGVGFDQLLQVVPGRGDVDAQMIIWNSDGSRAEMCGNGIRAAVLWMRDHGWKGDEARIATDGGIKEVWLESRDLVRVDMGVPEVSPRSESITTEWGTWNFYRCDMGNPHAVIFVDDVAKIPLEKIGPKIETDPRFPHRTNVEFVQVVGPHLKVRVWERGAGVTLACGTGACASAAVAIFLGKVGRKLRVVLPGGELGLEWPTNEDPIFMTGPATKVFEGELCELQR